MDNTNPERPANQQQSDEPEQAPSNMEETRKEQVEPETGTNAPWELMRKFSDDVDRIFSTLGLGGKRRGPSWARPTGVRGSNAGTTPARSSSSAWAPTVDISTRGDDLLVCVDLPGIKPEDVELETGDNQLLVRGEYRNEQERGEKGQGYWYTERSYGSFYRSIPLPPGINTDNAQASFKNGVLEVRLPGAARTINPPRRRIPIAGASQRGTDTEPNLSEESLNRGYGEQAGSNITGSSRETYDQAEAHPS